jgi:hypothetical protein
MQTNPDLHLPVNKRSTRPAYYSMIVSATFLLAVLMPSSVEAQAPANDNFATRMTITEGPTVTQNNQFATVEPFEPYPNSPSHTLWYTWTAPSDSIVTIDTTGTDYYTSFIAIYMGQSLGKLIRVKSDDSYSPSSPLRLTFKAKAGAAYQIVTGSESSSQFGNSKITLITSPFAHEGTLYGPDEPSGPTPANDLFDARKPLAGSLLTVIGFNQSATIEPFEPFPDSQHTLWYSWTAPSDAVVTIDTNGTNFYLPFIAVYVGESIGHLTPVVSDSGYSPTPLHITFQAKAHTAYQIVQGSTSSGEFGDVQFTLNAQGPPLVNISTRLAVQSGDNVLIGGLIVRGSDPKLMIVRAIGPSLAQAGVPGVLADPVLELHNPDGSLAFTNDNWQDNSSQARLIAEKGLAPQDSRESAIVGTFPPGGYTAVVRGKGGATGVALVEVYDVDQQPASSQLVNISTRGLVQTGDTVMIGGFIKGGSGSSALVVRAIGPSLASAGVAGALQDPVLELYNADGVQFATNNNWQDDSGQADMIGGAGLAPGDPRESAIFVNLNPGGYTAIVRGKDNGTGVGLVEVYNLGSP